MTAAKRLFTGFLFLTLSIVLSASVLAQFTEPEEAGVLINTDAATPGYTLYMPRALAKRCL